MSEVTLKPKRVTKNLGLNTAATQDASYAAIEAKYSTKRCGRATHEGERVLPIRDFYLDNGGKSLQGACIVCDKKYRAGRATKNRSIYSGKTPQEIYTMYLSSERGPTMECSKCKENKHPSEFNISIGMECGLHNHCKLCSLNNSQGNGGLRDFILQPDKDRIKYEKKAACERCQGTDTLAVDHILPLAKGGTDCISNKQTLCIHCNSKKCDTIDCVVTLDMLSVRYRDPSLDFTDTMSLSRILAKKVLDFRKSTIDNCTLDQIRISVSDYIKKYNLGHNLDRITGKIAELFNKT